MHIVTTHKGTDFDALASVVAANLLYPDVTAVLPAALNPNVRAFLSLHRGLFDYCTPEKVNTDAVDRLTVVDTNHWDRLDRMDPLKEKQGLEIILFDHHGSPGNIEPTWQCSEEMGANITLMLRYLKLRQQPMTPIQASLFLAGLYEDTGNLTFPSTRAEDAHAVCVAHHGALDRVLMLIELAADGGPNEVGAVLVETFLDQEVDLAEIDNAHVDGDLFSFGHGSAPYGGCICGG